MSEQVPTQRMVIAPSFLPGYEPPDGAPEPDAAAPPPQPSDALPAVTSASDTPPPGGALAELIAMGLVARGWAVEYRWTTYEGHALDARRGDHRYDVELALADAEQGTWRVSAKRRSGFFKRIFQGGVDPAEHALLRRDIDAALETDGRTRGGDAAWTCEPGTG
jgi:hypothetical protein